MKKEIILRNRKKDKAWDLIISNNMYKNELETNGHFFISPSKIRRLTGISARLLVKNDCYDDLPNIFKLRGLDILPISNTLYIVGKFNLYHELENEVDTGVKTMYMPEWIDTIDYKNISSETIILNGAIATGMLQDLFDGDVFIKTISGRKRTSPFLMYVKDNQSTKLHKIKIKGTQMEVDGGFESKDKLILIEVKNNRPTDFIIRQLYYPYREWLKHTQKDIYNIFLTHHEGIYTFNVYVFDKKEHYNSIRLIKSKKYRID